MLKLFYVALSLMLPITAWSQQVTQGMPANGLALNGSNVAGRSYFLPMAAAPTNAALTAANRLYAIPLFIGSASVLKQLSFDIGTGNASAWNARMCVYSDSGSGVPGALITNGDTGTIAIGSGSVTGIQTATVNGSTGITVGPGWIWLAFMADSASESVFSIGGGLGTQNGVLTSLLGAQAISSTFAGNGVSGVFMAQTFGACPASFGAVSYGSAVATPFVLATF